MGSDSEWDGHLSREWVQAGVDVGVSVDVCAGVFAHVFFGWMFGFSGGIVAVAIIEMAFVDISTVVGVGLGLVVCSGLGGWCGESSVRWDVGFGAEDF